MTKEELIHKLTVRLASCRAGYVNTLCTKNEQDMMKQEGDALLEIIEKLLKSN